MGIIKLIQLLIIELFTILQENTRFFYWAFAYFILGQKYHICFLNNTTFHMRILCTWWELVKLLFLDFHLNSFWQLLTKHQKKNKRKLDWYDNLNVSQSLKEAILPWIDREALKCKNTEESFELSHDVSQPIIFYIKMPQISLFPEFKTGSKKETNSLFVNPSPFFYSPV